MSVPVVVGLGRPGAALAEAAGSYAEARHPAEVAARVPGLGRSVPWERLGVYRMLTRGPDGELHPGLEPLLGRGAAPAAAGDAGDATWTWREARSPPRGRCACTGPRCTTG